MSISLENWQTSDDATSRVFQRLYQEGRLSVEEIRDFIIRVNNAEAKIPDSKKILDKYAEEKDISFQEIDLFDMEESSQKASIEDVIEAMKRADSVAKAAAQQLNQAVSVISGIYLPTYNSAFRVWETGT